MAGAAVCQHSGPVVHSCVLLAADIARVLTSPSECGCCALFETFRFLPFPVFSKTLTWAWPTLPDVCADTKVASALGSLEVLALELERQG